MCKYGKDILTIKCHPVLFPVKIKEIQTCVKNIVNVSSNVTFEKQKERKKESSVLIGQRNFYLVTVFIYVRRKDIKNRSNIHTKIKILIFTKLLSKIKFLNVQSEKRKKIS